MRLQIRKVIPKDAKSFVELWNEGIRRGFFIYTGNNKLRSKKDELKARKKYSSQSKLDFSFIAFDNDKAIGFCNASGKDKGRMNHRVELGWFVHPDYAGKGVATNLLKSTIKEAKKLMIKRLEAEISVKNIASIRLAKKFGFKIEGIRKAGLFLDNGKYSDTYLFGKIIN